MLGADDRSLLFTLLGPSAAERVQAVAVTELLESGPRRLRDLGLDALARDRLLAAAELARRFQPAFAPPRPVRGPRDALPHLESLRRSRTEVLGVLALDARQSVLGGLARVAQGSVSHITAEPREVFAAALERRASAIVLAHNHPSGVTDPSPEDVAFTRAMLKAGELLAIPVLDHVVVAERSWFSFLEQGLLN